MRDKAWFPVLYMFIVTAIASSILLGVNRLTSSRVTENRRSALRKALLASLAAESAESIKEPDKSSAGAYRLVQNGETIAYAVPFEGTGFWALIKGVVGIRADMKTITGIAIYEQRETPGLGGEIVKPAFKGQFKGLRIKDLTEADGKSPTYIRFVKPDVQVKGGNEVHAVTGATQTSVRLETMINRTIGEWRKALKEGEK